MLKGFTALAAAALCLLGLSAFAQEAAAAQWVESGRTAHFRYSAYVSVEEHSCNVGPARIAGYPGSCANDAFSGWTANYIASSGHANDQLNACNHNPFQYGSACYGLAYAINGHAYAGGLPAACNVGSRAVVTSTRVETVVIEHEELSVDNVESAAEFVCQ